MRCWGAPVDFRSANGRIENGVRRLAAVVIVGLAFAAQASAGIAVDAVTPHSVRVGDSLRIKVSAGLRLWQPIPLYLVPSSRALRPKPCRRDQAICEPKVLGPPTAATGYVHIATISFRKLKSQVVTVTIPRIAPGRYEVAFYCGVCYRGPGGSLISTPTQAFKVVR